MCNLTIFYFRFMDSINCLNWYLCGDLVKLFAICPMNPARLKENVEVNQVVVATTLETL